MSVKFLGQTYKFPNYRFIFSVVVLRNSTSFIVNEYYVGLYCETVNVSMRIIKCASELDFKFPIISDTCIGYLSYYLIKIQKQ